MHNSVFSLCEEWFLHWSLALVDEFTESNCSCVVERNFHLLYFWWYSHLVSFCFLINLDVIQERIVQLFRWGAFRTFSVALLENAKIPKGSRRGRLTDSRWHQRRLACGLYSRGERVGSVSKALPNPLTLKWFSRTRHSVGEWEAADWLSFARCYDESSESFVDSTEVVGSSIQFASGIACHRVRRIPISSICAHIWQILPSKAGTFIFACCQMVLWAHHRPFGRILFQSAYVYLESIGSLSETAILFRKLILSVSDRFQWSLH